ncbi:MAG TPA: Gfo/Idh/MocA family oxidoreductase [Verrucomicrobiae bacterium]|jgi:predicted dehydrogenase
MTQKNTPFNVVRSELRTPHVSRRHFIYTTVLAASALAGSLPVYARRPNFKSPNEKLDIAGIGTGGRADADLNGVSGENIVALCDVDSNNLANALKKYPGARTYSDYRVMLEKEKSIDAVTVAVPDHHHAPAAMRAMAAGKHVYVEKPLTHTVWEARQMTLAARKYGVATQMGNQGHSGEGIRQLCEMIWSGAIGTVAEVHCWTDRAKGWWTQGVRRPAGSDPVPSYLNWDNWIGAAPERPYLHDWPKDLQTQFTKAVYHPQAWRGWWDFGCGALGDMACHLMDCPQWALDLGAPSTVEVVSSSEMVPEMPPLQSVLRYTFPGRGKLPPCTLTWYDSGQKPPKPPEMEAAELQDNGSLFIGDKGKIFAGVYGEKPRLLPESSMADYKRPAQTIPRVPGNEPHLDWIRACKGGPKACSNFDISGPFTEWVLLGNLALRLNKKLEWDSKKLRVKNVPEAEEYIRKSYRRGWEIS